MSTMKRKSLSEGMSRARSSNKRQKADHNDATQKNSAQSESTVARTKQASLLTKEQPAFPRGGAGLLTPLERKQIHAKASRDAAAEQNRSGDLFGSKHTYSDASDLDDAASEQETEPQQEQKKVKRKTAKDKSKRLSREHGESTVTVEGLSYKRLAVGSQILGRISSINQSNLTVTLPNNLTGYVPLTEISNQFSSNIQSILAGQHDNADGEDENEDQEEDFSLQQYFRIGQYLRVSVTSLENDALVKTQAKRRIELSITPQKANSGLSKASLIVGSTVQAAVASIEDHGVVMDLGIGPGENVKGFISTKALGKSYDMSSMRTGSVLLCQVTGGASSGKVIKLSPDLEHGVVLKMASTIEPFLPGTLVEVLLSEVTAEGLAGKIMGMLDTTADIVHSGSYKDRESFLSQYKIGQKIRGRLLFTFPLSENKKIGFSVLPHLVNAVDSGSQTGSASLPISSIVRSAHVTRVASGLGVYLSLSNESIGFAHISRLSDKRVDSVSETLGSFKIGSEHKARILEHNPLDGLYIVSLQKSVIEQPFLRIEDVPVGEVVKATIEKVIIGSDGVSGVLVKLADGVTGFVPPVHFSDIVLLHPEKKFREGNPVTARVLSVNKAKRRIRLTLKKTLVNSDQRIWSDFSDISVGDSTVGTLVKVDSHGALVQFFGNVKGFLPVSEMSEAYIKDAKEHFKVGQVVNVNCISVNAEDDRLTVSCRERLASTETAIASVIPGTIVTGSVFEKSQNDLLLRLEGSEVIARLALDHVSDGSERKRRSNLEKVRVGQKLENLLVLEVQRKGRLVTLSNKQTLIKAAQRGELLKSFEDLQEDMTLTGFVSNITEDGVFIRYAHGISGLVPKRQVPAHAEEELNFGMHLLQAVTAKVMSIDYRGATPRFWLTMREGGAHKPIVDESRDTKPAVVPHVVNPVDDTITSFSDFSVGRVTKARITSVKDTQVNVELATDIQGRIDVSELFDKWEDIKDRKQPLRIFSPKQVLNVRVLGAHDSRNHRFLPLTHRNGKNTVFELSAKPSMVEATEVHQLSLSDMKLGSSWLAYVNNVADDYLMVNISPSLRGRIRAIDVADDLNLASDLDSNFPVGSAIRVKVLAVDEDKGRLDLTGKSSVSSKPLAIEDLTAGMILPGRVTRVSDRSILVQLSENVIGAVELIDMSDDYVNSDPAKYEKNDVIRVAVIRVDVPNKKVVLSTRPSKVLSSSLKVTDPEITSISQLRLNDIVRGFISNVADKGVFVTLGHGVTGFVRVTNLSDSFLKNWKENFQRDQLVKAKVILVDPDSGHIQLSFKESLMDANIKPRRTLASMHVGDVVTGQVAKVEVFGVFIIVDNSENVRGLCHRSQIAEQRVEDASKLFNEGDKVKAIVLKVDLRNRRINFGMKASYFVDQDDEINGPDHEADGSEASSADLDEGANIDDDDDDDDDDEFSQDEALVPHVSQNISEDTDQEDENENPKKVTGLSVGGFDWYGLPEASSLKRNVDNAGDDNELAKVQKKKRKRAEIQIDRTGDLDADGPQSTDDFERLLLGEPDSSMLWLQFMAFHLELGDIENARQTGERALRTINLGQDAEKMNIWIALLNLENAYGDEETIDSTFKRACEYNDPQEIYSRLISIYIQSGKHDRADNLFQDLLKKFTQVPKLYINYANFLFDTVNEPDRGRNLLSRALQVLPPYTHFDLTSKFAQLEFKSDAGLAERGRTIFEGLINSFPKRVDLFNIMLDMEIQSARKSKGGASDLEQVRALFERIFDRQLKPKQAKYFFKRWLAFEEEQGDDRKIDDVKARAATWVKTAGSA